MTRAEMIREWRSDVLLLFAGALGVAVVGFLVLCATAAFQGWFRRRKHRLHRSAKHIGRKDS